MIGMAAARRLSWALALGVSLGGCGDDPVRTPPPPAESGGLRVTWKVVGPDGTELACAAVGFSGFSVRTGGEPTRIPCGEAQFLERTGLVPGRYPLVISPEVFQGTIAEAYTYRANVQVEDQKITEHTAEILVDPSSLNIGTISLRWRIDGRMPSFGCDALGAETFRIRADDTSIEPFELNLPCEQGTNNLTMRRKGTYSLIGSLRDADGRVVRNQVRSAVITVLEGQTTMADFNFTENATVTGSLEARWTVTGSAAAEGCPGLNGERVELTVLTGELANLTAIATTSIACDRGVARLDRLPVGEDYRVRLDLFNGFDAIVADAFVTPIEIRDTRTTTVAVDLSP